MFPDSIEKYTFSCREGLKKEGLKIANIAYCRVSSLDQNLGRQYEAFRLRGIKIDKIFEEKVSGKNITDRPQLKAMLDYVRDDDTVYIESISRLARNVMDFLSIVKKLEEKGVAIVSLKENIDTSTSQGKFITTVFAALYELERDTVRERQREGIDLCLKEKRPYGRPKYRYSATFPENYKQWKYGKITGIEFRRREKIRRGSFYNVVKRFEKEHQAELEEISEADAGYI